jgi:hypothetical protein
LRFSSLTPSDQIGVGRPPATVAGGKPESGDYLSECTVAPVVVSISAVVSRMSRPMIFLISYRIDVRIKKPI